jgi:hypothetical protein
VIGKVCRAPAGKALDEQQIRRGNIRLLPCEYQRTNEASLYTLLQIFSVTLFEKMPMPQKLSEMTHTFEEQEVGNKLNLFGF